MPMRRERLARKGLAPGAKTNRASGRTTPPGSGPPGAGDRLARKGLGRGAKTTWSSGRPTRPGSEQPGADVRTGRPVRERRVPLPPGTQDDPPATQEGVDWHRLFAEPPRRQLGQSAEIP